MSTRVLQLDTLEPLVLDRYLAEGWYRMGPALMTCRYVLTGPQVRTALWMRLPLKDYRFRKSLRRLLRRTRARFRIEHGPVVVDEPREDLYKRYIDQAHGERSPTLQDFLGGDNPFDTREVSLWAGEQLVAYSLYDMGERAIESLVGVYDPERARHSLGFVTMLLEIEVAMAAGMDFFYPGYVMPGDPSMEYKHRVGPMEFFDHEGGSWRPLEELDPTTLASERLEAALDRAKELLLDTHGLHSEPFLNKMFEAPAYHEQLSRCLTEPLVLKVLPSVGDGSHLVLAWDVVSGCYELMRCGPGWVQIVPPGDRPSRREEVMVVLERAAVGHDPQVATQRVALAMTRRPGRRATR